MSRDTPDHPDAELQQRIHLLTELGLGESDEQFDAFAAELATAFAAQLGEGGEVPYAMVNLVTSEQYFVGLHCPDDKGQVGRTMSRDHGYCPEVVRRRKALVLPDVYAHPRFSTNKVADQIGIRTYAGAPLIHLDGTLLGTVCIVGTTGLPLSTGKSSLALIKDHAKRLMQLIDGGLGHHTTDHQSAGYQGALTRDRRRPRR
ncbi:GAF domain-containing protein [Actinomadura geliboluensis]|uniref:GAF domain-containing protein n=1 Tax=Actinomadura geliboluensis TaxID=882440 RepID=A0A5S4GYY7_9ACTN|nr:GAF domain-containing protein [Actinomadura geliboluensis]TMR38178.1 GAF domain-containing protein [Actinomadura geliboluensis]